MMLEELQRRNYFAITTRKYLQVVTNFAKHFGKSPDTYQAYLLQERKLASGTAVTSASFAGNPNATYVNLTTVSLAWIPAPSAPRPGLVRGACPRRVRCGAASH
jgi:hypothetical protein